MDIQELSDNNEKSLFDLFNFVQMVSSRPVQTKRTGRYQDLYSFLSKHANVLVTVKEAAVCAAMSFITLSGKNIFFITDLFKNPYDKSLVTFKMTEHFLELKKIAKENFCLVFVEENMKAFDGLRNYVIKKYQLQVREELIYSYIFSLPDSTSNSQNSIKETIDGVDCEFFTDKESRHFLVGGKKYDRTYVKINGNASGESFTKKIVEAGKKNAGFLGCNVFVLLLNDQIKLGEDHLYVNRKFELWNGPVGERVDLCKQGILI